MRTGDGTHFHHISRGTGSTLVPNPNPNSHSGQLTTTNGVSGTAVHYFELGGADDGREAVMVRWFDATSSATLVLQYTNLPTEQATFDSAVATEWATSAASITGPAASAAGCTMFFTGAEAGARRYRLKVTVAATTQLEIIGHGVH